MKKDDASLSEAQLRAVRNRADLLLKKAGAYGRFPTPVEDLIKAANLEVEREISLDGTFMGALYKRLPNSVKVLPDRVKQASQKLMGLLHRADRTILLDHSVHEKQKIFLSLHEVAHDFLDWQRSTYEILEDSESELDHDTQDLFEREANCFASEVLFQVDTFTVEAADHKFGLKAPIQLAKKYGPSLYSTLRRYVSTHSHPCLLVVFNPPLTCPKNGIQLSLRRAVPSVPFTKKYGTPDWKTLCDGSNFIGHLPANKFTAPTMLLLPLHPQARTPFILEGFNSTRQVFFLLYPAGL